MCVAAWAYITAAVAMGTTAVLFVDGPGWEVPPALVGPLAYWIIICSVLGYYVVTWATQHLPASQVLGIPALRRLADWWAERLGCSHSCMGSTWVAQHVPCWRTPLPSKKVAACRRCG